MHCSGASGRHPQLRGAGLRLLLLLLADFDRRTAHLARRHALRLGATIGTVVGFFFIPPLGILLGPFVGAVIGELCHNREDISKAFLVGFGSFLSFIVGTGLKLIAAVGMFVHISADTYPVVREWFASIF